MSDGKPRSLDTIAAHALTGSDPVTGSVVPPLVAATTFARDQNYELRGASSYARGGNPTLGRQCESVKQLRREFIRVGDSVSRGGEREMLFHRQLRKELRVIRDVGQLLFDKLPF